MLQIVWTAPVPVLAVPPTMERLPRRALVAVDFSAASRRAATTALTVLGASATITLAHVHPAIDFAALGRPGWDAIYARGRDALLQELGAEFGQAKGITVETALLRGEPAPALLDFAAAGAYDLIVAGTQGVAALDQHALGSTSTALLRGAACAVLIAPTPEVVA
jgi:nucleotide-binding universal stress UspA family protein